MKKTADSGSRIRIRIAIPECNNIFNFDFSYIFLIILRASILSFLFILKDLRKNTYVYPLLKALTLLDPIPTGHSPCVDHLTLTETTALK